MSSKLARGCASPPPWRSWEQSPRWGAARPARNGLSASNGEDMRQAVQHEGDRTMQHNRNVSQDKWSAASDAIVAAFNRKLQPLGTGVLRYGLVGLLLFWGSLKFAQFEAEAIQPLLAYSPLISWMLAVFDVRTASATNCVLDPISPAFGFLVKNLILLGAALYTAGEALRAHTDPVPAPETEGGSRASLC